MCVCDQVTRFSELLMGCGMPPLPPQLGAARSSLRSARQARRGDPRNDALTLGSAARRHNARAQQTAVIEVLRCIHDQMVMLHSSLKDGRPAATPDGQRFVDAFKGTQMWLFAVESDDDEQSAGD